MIKWLEENVTKVRMKENVSIDKIQMKMGVRSNVCVKMVLLAKIVMNVSPCDF